MKARAAGRLQLVFDKARCNQVLECFRVPMDGIGVGVPFNMIQESMSLYASLKKFFSVIEVLHGGNSFRARSIVGCILLLPTK